MDDGSCCETLDKDGSNCCDKTGKNKETGLCCDVSTIANCPTGKGDMCIVDYLSGDPLAATQGYYDYLMDAHLSGFCID